MFIYRPKKYLLEDAMKEAKCFNSLDELKHYVVEYYSRFCQKVFDAEDLVLDDSSQGDDGRTGWKNDRYICTKRWGEENYIQKYGCAKCVGFVGEVDDNYVPEKWMAWRYWHRKHITEQLCNNIPTINNTKRSNEMVSPNEEVKFYCKCGCDFRANGSDVKNYDRIGETEFYYIKCPKCGNICVSDSSYIVKES